LKSHIKLFDYPALRPPGSKTPSSLRTRSGYKELLLEWRRVKVVQKQALRSYPNSPHELKDGKRGGIAWGPPNECQRKGEGLLDCQRSRRKP